ncbi:hypothetical protein ACHAWF_010891 [Thalassiosira exigua]
MRPFEMWRSHGGVSWALALSMRLAPAKPTALDELHAAILRDFVEAYDGHDPSPVCDVASSSDGTTSFSFDYPGENVESEWYEEFSPFEAQLFQAILSFDDPSGDKSWSVRVGAGGNLYSHFAPDMWGESLPPQRHGTREDGKGKSPWVDEVYQSVSVNTELNQINREYDHPQYCTGDPTLPPSDPDHGKCQKMYVHQAGAYTLDPPHTDDAPFYSPSLARRCEGNTCTFAGWGTSAHLVTPFTSSILYVNRYTDCGEGVIEHTQIVHNMADPLDPASTAEGGLNTAYDFFNVPWAGIRPSNLPYALEPNAETGTMSYDDPNDVDYLNLCRFGGSNLFGDPGHDSRPEGRPAWRGMVEDLRDTSGFTTFVQRGLVVNETEPFRMPCRVASASCREDARACMVQSCTDEEVAAGTHVRMQLKVAPGKGPECAEHEPEYDNTYNKYAVLQCKMRDADFGQNGGFVSGDEFPCRPWVQLKFVNARTEAALDVPYVRHFSWSPRNRIVYFAVNEVDVDAAIEMVNDMFDNTDGDDDLLINVRTVNGIVDDVPANYDPSSLKAFTYVYGKGEDFGGPGGIAGRVQRRVGSTESLPRTRDYGVFTVRWLGFGARLPPGQTFHYRIYNFVGDLGDAAETASELLPGTFAADIDPEQWSPRRVDVYRSGDYFSVVAAREAEGDETECPEGGVELPVCSGKSSPSVGHVPYFYVTCEESTYFGKDPYHFTPPFGAEYPAHGTVDDPVRSYLCNGLDATVRPTWKLMGFFPSEGADCASLEGATYDESEFACNRNAVESSTEAPTLSPTNATASDTSSASPTATPTTLSPSREPTEPPVIESFYGYEYVGEGQCQDPNSSAMRTYDSLSWESYSLPDDCPGVCAPYRDVDGFRGFEFVSQSCKCLFDRGRDLTDLVAPQDLELATVYSSDESAQGSIATVIPTANVACYKVVAIVPPEDVEGFDYVGYGNCLDESNLRYGNIVELSAVRLAECGSACESENNIRGFWMQDTACHCLRDSDDVAISGGTDSIPEGEVNDTTEGDGGDVIQNGGGTDDSGGRPNSSGDNINANIDNGSDHGQEHDNSDVYASAFEDDGGDQDGEIYYNHDTSGDSGDYGGGDLGGVEIVRCSRRRPDWFTPTASFTAEPESPSLQARPEPGPPNLPARPRPQRPPRQRLYVVREDWGDRRAEEHEGSGPINNSDYSEGHCYKIVSRTLLLTYCSQCILTRFHFVPKLTGGWS